MARYLAPLITLYVLLAALVIAGSPRAAEQPASPNPTSPGSAPTAAAPTPPEEAEPAQPAQPQQPPQQTEEERAPAESPPVAVAAGPGSVSIVDFGYRPGSITVNVGDTVTWTNTGDEGHSATGSGFDTGILSKGQSGSHTFNSAGTFRYQCTPHPFMKGTVVVQAASSGGGGSGGGSSGGGSSGGGSSGGGSPGGGGGGSSAGGSEASGSSRGSSSDSSGASGPGLPATGGDAALLGALGLALLALGFAIRRRAGDLA